MTKWTDNLTREVYYRLCDCTTRKGDLYELVAVRHAWNKAKNKNADKEDALIEVLELLDCNGCFFDLTTAEYNTLKY